jgi:hypothetical protein
MMSPHLEVGFPEVAKFLEDAKTNLFAVSSFLMAHWTKDPVGEPLERANAEI